MHSPHWLLSLLISGVGESILWPSLVPILTTRSLGVFWGRLSSLGSYPGTVLRRSILHWVSPCMGGYWDRQGSMTESFIETSRCLQASKPEYKYALDFHELKLQTPTVDIIKRTSPILNPKFISKFKTSCAPNNFLFLLASCSQATLPSRPGSSMTMSPSAAGTHVARWRTKLRNVMHATTKTRQSLTASVNGNRRRPRSRSAPLASLSMSVSMTTMTTIMMTMTMTLTMTMV